MIGPVSFQVIGLPAPQGSKRAVILKGPKPRAVLLDGSSDHGKDATKAWRQAVADTAHHEWDGRPPIDGPVSLTVRFVLPRPKSAPKKNRWHASRPDLDKLLRATKDALKTAGVYTDDGRVACVTATKTLADPSAPWTGATITIYQLGHEEEVA